jgi:uncharacterized membrane protein YdjX (TVP38/TMEM64 family)
MAGFTEDMIETMASAAGIHPTPALVTLSLDDEEEEEEGKREGRAPRQLCLRIDEAVVEEDDDHLHELEPAATHPSSSSSSLSRPKMCKTTCCSTVKKLRPVLLLLLVVTTFLVGGSYLCVRYRDKVLEASEYIRQEAPRSAVYYALIVALWIILCLPSTIIELLGGAIFSYPVALLTLTVGKQLGCTIAFLIGKLVASKSMRDALGRPHSPPSASSSSEAAAAAAVGQRAQSNAIAVGSSSSSSSSGDEKKKSYHEKRRGRQPSSSSNSSNNSNNSNSNSSSSSSSSTKPTSKRKRTIQAMFYAMECHPWKIALLLRFLPIPISVKNFGMACLPCPTHVFIICTFVASLPFTFIWVNLGESTKSLLEALSGKGEAMEKHGFFAQEVALLVVGLLLLLLLLVILKRYTQQYAAVLEAEEAARLAAAATAAAVAEAGKEEGVGGRREPSTATSSRTLSPMPTWAMTEEGEGEEGREDGDDDDDARSCFGQRRRSRELSFGEGERGREGEVLVVVPVLIQSTEDGGGEGKDGGRKGQEEEKEEQETVDSPSSVASVA